MELRHLRYFCAVAETLNFSRAAERMRVAQSALSRQIRDLETELGAQLFVRTTTSVRLTDAGSHFHQAVEKLLVQLSIAATGAQEIANGRGGDFNVASDWRFPINMIPETVRKFRNLYPKVRVNFSDLQPQAQLEALRAGKIHLGFVPDIVIGARDDLGLLHIYTGELAAVLPPSHRLAKRESLALRELADEKWIRVGEKEDSFVRAFMLQICRPAGFTPKMGRNTPSVSGALALVSSGEGIILLPPLIVPSGSGVCLIPTDCAPVKLHAVWLKRAASPLVKSFVEFLTAEVAKLSSKPLVLSEPNGLQATSNPVRKKPRLRTPPK